MDDLILGAAREELLKQKNLLNAQIGERKKLGQPIEDLLEQSVRLSARLKQPAKPKPAPPPAQITCSVASSSAEITALRDEWRALAAACPDTHLYATWEWAEAWYGVYEGYGEIHCLLVRGADQRLVGLAPLFIPLRGDSNLATRQAGFVGTWGSAWGHYPEFLLAQGYERTATEAMVTHLAESAPSWRGLKLMRMKPSSQTLPRLAGHAAGHGLRLYLRPGLTTALAELPDDPEQVLESYPRKHRSDTRRALKHLSEDHPGAQFRVLSNGDEGLQVIETVKALNIARRRSKDVDSNFAKPEYCACHDRSGRNFLDAGWVRTVALVEDDEIVSATYGAVYGDCLYVISSGFKPAYARYDPSHLVLLHLSQQAVREGIKRMDMLTWYPYKTAICPIREQLVDVVLFADESPGSATVAAELLRRSARLALKRLLGIRRRPATPTVAVTPSPTRPTLASC